MSPTPTSATPPSFWLDEISDTLTPRPPLEGERTVDVAIVGAGFTGLWIAYYLARAEPALRIAVVESQQAGFGAAGRNGGWCSLHLTGIDRWLLGRQAEAALALQRLMFDAVDEVGRISAEEGIDCGFAKAGFLNIATNAPEVERSKAGVEEAHKRGYSEYDIRWLGPEDCDARIRLEGRLGGVYSPHAAAVQPAKLARGIASAAEARGVTIYERSPARELAPGAVTTDAGVLRARIVLRATEGYTPSLPGVSRQLMPMHSMMLVTEPLPDAFWKEVGCADRVVFGDVRRILSYAQRTVDGRIALGSGGRYFFGSAVMDRMPPDHAVFRAAQTSLHERFPMLRDVRITHRWLGAFGVTRDTKPFVRFDPKTGMGAAGGYTGNGVAAANLAARTLTDVILEKHTELCQTPWVQHESPDWEPEPFRWLGANGILRMGAIADRNDERGRAPRWQTALFSAASGH